MKWNLFYSAVAVLLLGHHTVSFSEHTENIKKSWQPFSNTQGDWFLTFGAGAQFPELHSHTYVANGSEPPQAYDQYSIKNDNNAVITVSAGKRWQQNTVWFPAQSLGVYWQYLFKTDVHGTIAQYSLPELTNYNYHLNLSSNILLLSGKLNLLQYGKCSPFVNGGVGSAFNRVSNYNETVLSGIIPRVSPGFRNTTTSAFAYNLGAGLDLQIIPQWIFSLGYIFQDLGSVSSGAGVTTWSKEQFHLGNYHTNEILITTSYLFG